MSVGLEGLSMKKIDETIKGMERQIIESCHTTREQKEAAILRLRLNQCHCIRARELYPDLPEIICGNCHRNQKKTSRFIYWPLTFSHYTNGIFNQTRSRTNKYIERKNYDPKKELSQRFEAFIAHHYTGDGRDVETVNERGDIIKTTQNDDFF